MLLRNKFFSIIAIAFSFLATVAYAGGDSQNNALEESKKEDGKIDIQKSFRSLWAPHWEELRFSWL